MTTDKELQEVLYEVMDPELHMNIMDIGLVYRAQVTQDNVAEVDFTLTYPGCPLGDQIINDIETKIRELTDVKDVRTLLVWDPPWDPQRMSENARLLLGYPI